MPDSVPRGTVCRQRRCGMARKPEKPWLRKGRGWYVKIGGRQVHLGPDEQAAWEAFRRLMERRPHAGTTATGLVSAFLAAKTADVRARTLEGYRVILEPFAASLPADLAASAVEPRHIAEFCAGRDYGPNTAKQVRRVVKMAWRWAKAAGLIADDRLAGVKVGVIGRRPDATETDLAAWLAHVREPEVRLYVEIGLGTGMRPGELVRMEWRDVDPARRRVLIRQGKTGDRHVMLSQQMLDRLRELARANPTGPLLRSTTGKPWCLHYLSQLFRGASHRAGVTIVPMHLRHLFATRLCEAGTNSLVLSRLMGHSSTRMVDQYYVAVSESSMLRALDKVG